MAIKLNLSSKIWVLSSSSGSEGSDCSPFVLDRTDGWTAPSSSSGYRLKRSAFEHVLNRKGIEE